MRWSNSLRSRFADLLERHVPKLAIKGTKATGLCLFHPDRHPSFSADLAKGVFHCFGCGIGGGVKKFAELVGEPWNSAHRETRAVRVHRAAMAAAQEEFGAWERQAMVQVTDRYREILGELEVARIAYRATICCPDYTTEEKRYWRWRVAELVDLENSLSQICDVFTYNAHRRERLDLWVAVTGQVGEEEGKAA
jgi:hypothetical protein